MTHKEYSKHTLLLNTIDWLVKKSYGVLLIEKDAILIDVVRKLEKPMNDDYWNSHTFISVPGFNGDQDTYFIFVK